MNTIVALHGFLGVPDDLQFLKSSRVNDVFHAPDLFDGNLFHPKRGLPAAGEALNEIVRGLPGNKILLGYSLGGRIALHALKAQPQLWSGAIFISTHPGLTSEKERGLRLKHDDRWAERFEKDSWEQLMRDWNAQEVFNGHFLHREEREFCRPILADVLRGWSLGAQEDLIPMIESFSRPILWLVGDLDKKLAFLVKKIHFKNPHSKSVLIDKVGHRLLWEDPMRIIQELDKLSPLSL